MTMVEYSTVLEERIINLTNENTFLKGLLNTFWSGDVPENATLDHMIIAKAGRFRLAEKDRVCALLGG